MESTISELKLATMESSRAIMVREPTSQLRTEDKGAYSTVGN